MFDSLSDKLGNVFDKLRGKGSLREEDVDTAMREIRIALLEADVALPVAKDFIARVKERAIGQDVIKGINPAQQVIKIVNDALIEVLGGDEDAQHLSFGAPPCAYLMVGLQGSGKTTSSAKIAVHLRDKHKKKVLMASLDVHRPAAQEQLAQLGTQTNTATLPVIEGQQPVEITHRALKAAKDEGYDVVILDTAGRLSIDETLMQEVSAVKDAAKPVETLLVADAMTGQDAINTAKAFDERLNISGVMLTRMDGDARGGAALSMRAVTGKPVKLIGVGEKWDALEPFHPDRVAGRILGMGDVVSLVEKASETIDREDAQKLAEKFKKGQFDFNDLLSQMRQMKKMGGAGAMMKMLPGLGKMAKQIEEAGLDDTIMKQQEAIILSMTMAEREKPKLLNASRRKRIAAGSGTSVQEINKLVKQLEQMQTVMKRMKKMGMGNMMGMMKKMMGDDGAEAMMKSMDPDALAQSMSDAESGGPLGANPFEGSTATGGGLGANPFADPSMGGMGGGMNMPGLQGLPTRGGTKKNRKKKKKR